MLLSPKSLLTGTTAADRSLLTTAVVGRPTTLLAIHLPLQMSASKKSAKMAEGRISMEPQEEDSLSTRTRQAMQHLLPLFDKLPHNVLFAEDVMTSIKSPSFTAYCGRLGASEVTIDPLMDVLLQSRCKSLHRSTCLPASFCRTSKLSFAPPPPPPPILLPRVTSSDRWLLVPSLLGLTLIRK